MEEELHEQMDNTPAKTFDRAEFKKKIDALGEHIRTEFDNPENFIVIVTQQTGNPEKETETEEEVVQGIIITGRFSSEVKKNIISQVMARLLI